MSGNEIIRGSSAGSVRIDTPRGNYWLFPVDLRTLLVFGNMVPLRQEDGIIDGTGIAYPHPGTLGIIIALSGHAYLIPRTAFVMVAQGLLAATDMTIIPVGI